MALQQDREITDQLYGGDGSDYLNGSSKQEPSDGFADQLSGGADQDTFVIFKGGARDWNRDFTLGIDL
jgi:hypothetical protein